MRSSILSVTLFCSMTYTAVALADQNPRPSEDAVQAAFDRFVQAASRTDRSAELEARDALVSLGPYIIPKLVEGARGHSNLRVRRSCYALLTRSFADDERTLRVAYYYEEATGKDDPLFRFTLAKSLAQLGKAEALPVLIAAVSDEGYACREVGNAGLKALSGKSLEDFGGYDWREGAYTSGGVFSMPGDALEAAERKCGRFQAARAYLIWLKTERPELYRSVNYRPMSRRAAMYAERVGAR